MSSLIPQLLIYLILVMLVSSIILQLLIYRILEIL
jgi:hypothetical protein